MTDTQTIRVLIVDDHALVRSGIKDFLFAFEWLELVGEAHNGLEAVEFCREQAVDVVLMDLVMPLMNGSEATRRIMALGKPLNVIVLTSFHEDDLVQEALQAGATSYLLKNVNADDLADAIRAAHRGRATLAPEATDALIQATRRQRDIGFDLTDREQDVLALLVKGCSNNEISSRLSISVATTKYHLMNIYGKLGAKNRVEAAAVALENDLVNNER